MHRTMFRLVKYLSYIFLLNLSDKQLYGMKFGQVYSSEIFVTLYFETLKSCQQNCVDRPNCSALNFNTHLPRDCLLNWATATTGDLTDRIGWVYQNRSELKVETSCDICSVNMACDRGHNKCVYKECEVIKNSDHFILLGNGNAVGSKAVMACPRNKFPESPGEIGTWPIAGVCEDAGLWTLPRLICVDYENICHKYIVGPETRQKTMDWSTFLVRDVMLVSGPCGVPDNKITSSTKYVGLQTTYWAYWAKFDFQLDTWVIGPGDKTPYLQVAFDHITEVKGIRIRGRKSFQYHMYPTMINITYNTDCSPVMIDSFVPNKTGGANFTGNTDSTSVVEHMFETPIDALCIRVNILDYVSTYTPNPTYFGMKMDCIGTVKLPTV